MKKLTIIARYNENIEWSKKLDGDILIYNKGEDWPWEDIPRVDVKNYGRESETFVRSIIECYEMLNNYDCVIFLQGNPFDHDDDPIESINEYNSNQIIFLANSMVTYKLPEEKNYFNFEAATICKLFRKEYQPKATFTKLSGDLDENDDRGTEICSSIYFAQMLGIDLSKREITYSAGAQYIVPTSYIKLKNFEWWTEFYTLIEDWQIINPGDDVGAYCERMWLSIWEHIPNLDRSHQAHLRDLNQIH